jgi:hypothetical protein
MINQPMNTAKDRGGNGKYKPLKKVVNKEEQVESNEFKYLDSMDTRMRFNTSRDPIYFAFEYLERRSVTQLAGDFITDSFKEITNFVSKVIR